MDEERSTPRADGLSMPAEWEPHEACYMEWPTLTRRDFWADRFDEAKHDYAAVANAIAAFEPVVMVCDPDQETEARRSCSETIEILPLPIDDSWMRDNGPIFVRNDAGRVALVHFRFNSWGERFLPYDKDAQVPRHVASHLGMRRFEAPFVLEAGSFFVDGEGTLITTEQCLLNLNRNPTMSKEQIEQGLRDFLGLKTIIWLGLGHSTDRDTDGGLECTTRGPRLQRRNPAGTKRPARGDPRRCPCRLRPGRRHHAIDRRDRDPSRSARDGVRRRPRGARKLSRRCPSPALVHSRSGADALGVGLRPGTSPDLVAGRSSRPARPPASTRKEVAPMSVMDPLTDARPVVVFLCVQNAGRSQMAAGWMQHLAGDNVEVYSGGSDPASVVNPAAIEVMAEVGIDISNEFPKPWTEEVVRAADVIVTMGCGDSCPIFPGKRYLDWEVGDPKDLPLEQVRPIRDDIGDRVRAIIEELGIPARRSA